MPGVKLDLKFKFLKNDAVKEKSKEKCDEDLTETNQTNFKFLLRLLAI